MKYERLTEKEKGYYDGECIAVVDKYKISDTFTEEQQTEAIMERLWELETKLEQGKLVELPCKVGDICYFVYTQDQKQPIEIIATEITTKFIDNEFAVFVFENGYGGRASGNKKVVFSNKAQAEARLKELQNGTTKTTT